MTTRAVRSWQDRYRRQLIIADAGVIITAVTPAYLLGGVRADLVAVMVFAATWYSSLALVRSRDPKIIGSGAEEYRLVSIATLVVVGAAVTVSAAFHEPQPGLGIAAVFVTGIVGLPLGRWAARRHLVRRRRDGSCHTRVVVVGEPGDVARVIDRLQAGGPASEYVVVGAVVPRPGDGTTIEAKTASVPIVSSTDYVGIAVASTLADAIVVAGPIIGDHDYLRRLAWQFEDSDVALILSPGLTDVAGPRIHVRPIDGVPLVHVELPQHTGAKHALKRMLDLVLAAAALVLLAPLMIAIAVAIRRSGPGPVFFRQARVGLRGVPFTILKFRTMVVDAESRLAALAALDEGAGPLFKMKDDPRITPVGRLLRRYSLDELPQLFNVLGGSMSLVGPRPPLASEVGAYTTPIERRLFAKPGITGMWQINGRSDLDWDESVRLDLFYVENWSIAGDLVILWRTARVVLAPRGAY